MAAAAILSFPISLLILMDLCIGLLRGDDQPSIHDYMLVPYIIGVQLLVLAASIVAISRVRRRPSLDSLTNVALASFAVLASAMWLALPVFGWIVSRVGKYL